MKTTQIVTLIAAVMMAALITFPASAANVYNAITPTANAADPNAPGFVQLNIRGGGNSADVQVFYANIEEGLTPDFTYHPDGTDIAGQNAGYKIAKAYPDGTFEPLYLAAGTYQFFLRQGNGDQPEMQTAKVGAGDTTYISFLGAARPAAGTINNPEIKITEALYGAIITVNDPDTYIEHPAETHILHHDAITHTETIIDTPAYTETIHHPAITHTVHHDAITHTETTHYGDYTKIGGHMAYLGHNLGDYNPHFDAAVKSHGIYMGQYDKTGSIYTYIGAIGGHYQLHNEGYTAPTTHAVIDTPAYDETIIDQAAYDTYIYHEAITHTITITDAAAYDETIIDTPAYTETIHHSHTEGAYTSIKTEIEQLLNDNIGTFMLRNDANPGGIFTADGNTLLKTIADPAYGYVKTISITGTRNGAPFHIDADEYEAINLYY